MINSKEKASNRLNEQVKRDIIMGVNKWKYYAGDQELRKVLRGLGYWAYADKPYIRSV